MVKFVTLSVLYPMPLAEIQKSKKLIQIMVDKN